jgi:hypothetical protein
MYKGYKSLLTCENMWLMQVNIAPIPLCCVFFLFFSYETCAMVTKTMKLHMLLHLEFPTKSP